MVLLCTKGLVIIEQASKDPKNLTPRFQNHIHDINMFDSDDIMSCSTAMSSVANILNIIYLGGPLWYESTYEYYNEKNDTFGMLFKQYTASAVDNIYHPSIFNEFETNIDKEAYEEKHN